jgi:hypothetical protein
LQDLTYVESGNDKCAGVREKSKLICELVSDPQRLEEEREFARKTRDKFAGVSSTSS